MSRPKKKPKLVANRIPNVTVLCKELGFGTEARPMTELTNTTQFWRKRYKTPSGSAGKDLTDWKHDQEDFYLMTQEYLDGHGFGAQLWPTRLPEDPPSVLEYPADKER